MLPVDEGGENRREQARTIAVELGEPETAALLQELPKAYGTQIQDVLLTALGEALQEWTGARGGIVVNVEGHGREELEGRVDVSRTVGWFTAIYPMVVGTGEGTLMDRLKAMKQRLRELPGGGIGYGVLKYVKKDPELKGGEAEVAFNYLGQLDTVLKGGSRWRLARETAGLSQERTGRRPYLVDIVAQVIGGRLRVNWRYAESIHRPQTIQAVADRFIATLQTLIDQASSSADAMMRADLSLSDLSPDELCSVLGRVDVDL
jgi:non-ribosomal peptide synthase protein (TIGR01720 family)